MEEVMEQDWKKLVRKRYEDWSVGGFEFECARG